MLASSYLRTGRSPLGFLTLLILPILLVPGVFLVTPGNLPAQHPPELQGRVLDSATGQGLAGVQATVVGTGSGAVSDGDGRVRIRSLSQGPVVLRLERMGYATVQLALLLRNGQVTRFRQELEPAPVHHPGIQVTAPREAWTAGASFVLERPGIEASGARTLGEILEGRPGLMVVQRGPGGAQELQMRGGVSDQILVLLDGVPLNDPLSGTADLSRVAAGEIERVQVLPGARSAHYGPGALAGVVLVETRPAQSTAELTAQAGSLGEKGGEARLVRTHSSGWSVGAMGGIREMEGRFPFAQDPSLGGGRELRRNADLRHRHLHLLSRGPLGEGEWTVRLRGELQERGIPGKSFAPSDSARQSQGSLTATTRWTRSSPDDGRRLDLRAQHVETRLHLADPAPPAGPPFDDRTHYRETGAAFRLDEDTFLGTGVEVAADLELTRREIFGDGLREEGVPTAMDGGIGLRAGRTLSDVPLHPRLTGALRLHRDDLQDQWFPAHDLTLQLGGRVMNGHLTHRTSFSPPSVSDLFFREGVGIEPNPFLRAERVPSEWEVGLSGEFSLGGAELLLSGQYFQGDMEDMILWAPDFRFVWSPRNTDVERDGIELQGELDLASKGLVLSGHISSVRATYGQGAGEPGTQVIYRPRRSGGLSVNWRRGGWQVGLNGQYMGHRYPVPAAANALEGFWTVDLTVGGPMALGDWVAEPRLRVHRLNGETAPFIHAVPEPGRTVSFQLTLRHGG